MIRTTLLVLAAASVPAAHAVQVNSQPTENLKAGECVDNYDAAKGYDFFPEKYVVGHADLFTVTYALTYKTIVSGGKTVIAYQCGTPNPGVAGADLIVQVPVTKVGITSQTYITWIELLGERESIKHFTSLDIPSKVTSPCLKKIAAEGGCTDVNANTPDADTALQAAGVEVTFSEAWPYPSLTYNKVVLSAKDEDEVLEAAEYVALIAFYYNKEAEATAIHDSIDGRYNCVKDNIKKLNDAAVANDPKAVKPKVLWFGLVTDGTGTAWEAGKCPNYYCETISDAGGEPIDFSAEAPTASLWSPPWMGYYSDDQILSLAADADYVIFTQGHEQAIAEKLDMLNNIKAFQSGAFERVFHVQGRTMDDWFESRMPEPDVLLEDLVAAINPKPWSEHAMKPHTPVWIVPFNQAPVPRSSECPDVTAPHTLMADECQPMSDDLAREVVVSAAWRVGAEAASSLLVVGCVALLVAWQGA